MESIIETSIKYLTLIYREYKAEKDIRAMEIGSDNFSVQVKLKLKK